MLKGTNCLWTVGRLERLPNTSTLSPFLVSFCDKKGTIVRLQMVHKDTNIKQICFEGHNGVAGVT